MPKANEKINKHLCIVLIKEAVIRIIIITLFLFQVLCKLLLMSRVFSLMETYFFEVIQLLKVTQ